MYFLQFALLYTLFYLSYRLVLSRTGQLNANRYYLLGIYGLALLLPLLPWPPLSILPEPVTSLAPFVPTDIATPSIGTNTQLTELTTQSEQVVAITTSQIDWSTTLTLCYLSGVLFFLLRYGFQLWSLRSLISRSSPLTDHRWNGRARLISSGPDKNTAFTYGRCFYVSPNLLNSPDADLIMAHEYAHAHQRHTIDLTVSELFTTLLWWHPIAWLHRRDLRMNLEFLADRAVLNAGYSPKKYQLSLLRYCEPFAAQPALTFSQPPLKTRIVMMKSNQRSTAAYLSLFFATMLIGGLITSCSTQETVTPETTHIEAPFLKSFMGQDGWEQARALLQNNYTDHQVNYFVNGSPAQNEIIPKPQDIKIIELAANTEATGIVSVSFTTLQSNWISAMGWHATEAERHHEAETYNEWTVSLIREKERTNSYATAFYGNPAVYEGALDYIKEEYPKAGTIFYVDGELSDIEALKTPVEDVKAVVVAYANGDMTKVIFHIITSAS